MATSFEQQSQPDLASHSTPPLFLGRYQLAETIGRGGMASVIRAVDTLLGRDVAIKLLLPSISQDPEFVAQFLEMERRIARLFHPALVTIYDAGLSEEGCYVIMEYLPSGSLRDLLERRGTLPEGEAIGIIAQVAGALDLLHRERIIHGDIKPDNVLLDERGDAKLVDFGIARLATTTHGINAETLGGSVPYLAPEQLEHGHADARSDIYALGLVTYELLSGQRAFDGDNWVAVAAARLARDPAPLSRLVPGISPALEAAVQRALARNPADRFASAESFRQALLASLPGRDSLAAAQTQRLVRPLASSPAPSELKPSELTSSAGQGTGTPLASVRHSGAAGLQRLGRTLVQIFRGEHALTVPILVVAVTIDLLLLVAILASLGSADGTPIGSPGEPAFTTIASAFPRAGGG